MTEKKLQIIIVASRYLQYL